MTNLATARQPARTKDLPREGGVLQPAAKRDADSAVVAMVGAGQLARMTQQAAISLSVHLRVLGSSDEDPAVLAGATLVPGSPDRLDDLLALADGADVLTFDHEQIPPEHLARLEQEGVALAPAANAKLMAQDKLHARRELDRLGFPVPPFAHASTVAEVEEFASRHGWPLIAKLPRGGYDGRGVFPLAGTREAEDALAIHDGGLLLEPLLEIERELAILVARSRGGEAVAYPVVETVQREAMCREILAPAPNTPACAEEARTLALEVAERIDSTGILAVELFDAGGELLVNELALRPHNSGHYSIEGCVTSQFEQHLRSVLGWPLGSSALTAPAVVTVNVVGPADGSDPLKRAPAALRVPEAHIHLYGKGARPGRKLGHVTVCGRDVETARLQALRAVELLEGTCRD